MNELLYDNVKTYNVYHWSIITKTQQWIFEDIRWKKYSTIERFKDEVLILQYE